MRPLSILVGLALAGLGLGAPASPPHQVVRNVDGIPIIRTKIVRIDVDDDAAVGAPASFVPLLTTHLSKLVAGALERLHVPGLRKRPVFSHHSPTAMATADGDGNIMGVYGSNMGGRMRKGHGHRHRKPFRFYPQPGLKEGAPFIIVAVSMSVVVACLLLKRLVRIRARSLAEGVGWAPRVRASDLLTRGQQMDGRLLRRDGPARRRCPLCFGGKGQTAAEDRKSVV